MKILFKYIWTNMIEKKGRFILLILAISLSTGLFIGSQKATQTAIETNRRMTLEGLEKRTIGISSTDPNKKLKKSNVGTNYFKEVVPEITINNLKLEENSKEKIVSIIGRQPEDLPKSADFIGGKKEDISDKKIIISERTSKELDKKIGDKLSLTVNEKKLTLVIEGIVKNKGIFYNDLKDSFVIVMDQESLMELTDLPVNILTAKPISGKNVNDSIKSFNKSTDSMVAFSRVDDEQMKMISTQVTGIFMFMFLFVALMSILIISGAFKLMIVERLKTMGTFFSQGATWHQVRAIFLLESVAYGIIGGTIGILIGYGIHFIVNYIASPLREFGIYDKPKLTVITVIIGFIFSILLSVFSVLFPIMKLRHLSNKDIILQEPTYENDISLVKLIIGTILFISACLVAFIKVDLVFVLIGVVAGFVGFIFIYAKIVESSLKFLFQRLKNKVSILSLACQNVGTSKMIRNNITLTTIAVIVLIMINSIGVSFRSVLNESYKGYKFDVSVEVPHEGLKNQEKEIEKKMNASGVIKKSSNVKHSQVITTTRINDSVVNLTGVDNVSHYREYNQYLDWHSKKYDALFNKLKSETNTFISTKSYAKALNLTVGDEVNFDFGSETKEMTLVGLYDNKSGFNSLITEASNLPKTVKLTTPSLYFFETSLSPNKAKKKLNKYLKDFDVTVSTKKEQTDKNTEQNEIIINIFNVFATITTVIGSFGIVSNVTIAFLQRKKQFALYESLGIQKSQLIKMILFEGVIVSLLTIILSYPLLIIQTRLVEKALNEMIGATLNIAINYHILPWVYLFVLLLVIISSIPAILGSRKIEVVKELKFE